MQSLFVQLPAWLRPLLANLDRSVLRSCSLKINATVDTTMLVSVRGRIVAACFCFGGARGNGRRLVRADRGGECGLCLLPQVVQT